MLRWLNDLTNHSHFEWCFYLEISIISYSNKRTFGKSYPRSNGINATLATLYKIQNPKIHLKSQGGTPLCATILSEKSKSLTEPKVA